jgi:hypothetical protein
MMVNLVMHAAEMPGSSVMVGLAVKQQDTELPRHSQLLQGRNTAS